MLGNLEARQISIVSLRCFSVTRPTIAQRRSDNDEDDSETNSRQHFDGGLYGPDSEMSSGNLGSGSGGTSPYDDANSGSGGAPLPDFNASNIRLATIAPALGIPSSSLTSGPGSSHHLARTPDYLDYDQKGRGIVSTMFTNSGISYLIGVSLGGLYGLREGLTRTPSSRWKVKLNSVLNHCGRHGSGWGNMMGSTAILYSLYEGIADTVSSVYFCLRSF